MEFSRNIVQVFRVQLILGNEGEEQYAVFYENFDAASKYRPAEREFYVTREGNDWYVCTHSAHLICTTEFTIVEAAEEAEQQAIDLLSEFGYWKEEE